MDSQELLSEVASLCDDIGFRDFDKGEYINAIYRANRVVARKYNLFRKVYSFTVGNMTNDLSKDILLDLPDMKEPILVSVGDINLHRMDVQILPGKQAYSYYLSRQTDGTYLFNYILGAPVETPFLMQSTDITEDMSEQTVFDRTETDLYGKTVQDVVTIVYEALPERDYDESEYVIPQNYEEEQLAYAVLRMSQLGIARFKEEKLGKYSRLYNLYKKNSDKEKDFIESGEAIRIQPFQYP